MVASVSSSSEGNEWLSALPISQMTVTVYIPTSCVGAVIGRRGSTIAMIQKQAQTPNAPPVRVSIVGHGQSSDAKGEVSSSLAVVSPTLDPTLDPATTPTSVPFTYTPPRLYRSAMDSGGDSSRSHGRMDSGSKVAILVYIHSRCYFDLPIGRQRHASIVGKRGLTLQQLSASANCRIWVPPKELKLDVVQLEAPLEQCGLGLQSLGELLTEPKKSKTFQLQLTVPPITQSNQTKGRGSQDGYHHQEKENRRQFMGTDHFWARFNPSPNRPCHVE